MFSSSPRDQATQDGVGVGGEDMVGSGWVGKGREAKPTGRVSPWCAWARPPETQAQPPAAHVSQTPGPGQHSQASTSLRWVTCLGAPEAGSGTGTHSLLYLAFFKEEKEKATLELCRN